MKKLVLAICAAVLSCSVFAAPAPTITGYVSVTPGQPAPTYGVGYLNECPSYYSCIYGAPTPAGVWHTTYYVTLTAAGSFSIDLVNTRAGLSSGGRSHSVYWVCAAYQNFSVTDAVGNPVGAWSGQLWEGTSLPAGEYVVKFDILGMGSSTCLSPGNTRVYPEIVFQ